MAGKSGFQPSGSGWVSTPLDSTALTFGKNASAVAAGTFLDGPGGVASDLASSPPVIPYDATIIAMSAGADGAPGSAWNLKLQVDGVDTLDLAGSSGSATAVNSSYNQDVNAEARVGVRVGSVALDRPVVTVVFQRR